MRSLDCVRVARTNRQESRPWHPKVLFTDPEVQTYGRSKKLNTSCWNRR
jgi:hypothetical protein